MLRKVKMANKIRILIDEKGQVTKDDSAFVQVSNQGPLEITVEKKAQVEIELVMQTPLAISYVLKPFSNVKLVEIRDFVLGGDFKKKTILEHDSQLQAIYLNQSNHQGDLNIDEHCQLFNDAVLEVSYGELSDGNTYASYTYDLDGQGANAHLYLAAIAGNKDRKQYQVTLNHHAKNTYGFMENYGVVRHQSRLTFDGIGRIVKGMHQSESHQTSRIIVFEPQCIAKANPYLYIDDYDVKASHAASVGAMNEEHLYYLESRGLTKKHAMHLITMGYLLPAFKMINNDGLIKQIEDILLRKVGEE